MTIGDGMQRSSALALRCACCFMCETHISGTAGIAAAAAVDFVFYAVFADGSQNALDVGFVVFRLDNRFRCIVERDVDRRAAFARQAGKVAFFENFHPLFKTGFFGRSAGTVDAAAFTGKTFNKDWAVERLFPDVFKLAFDVFNAGYLHQVGFLTLFIGFKRFNHAAFDRVGSAFFGLGHDKLVENGSMDVFQLDVFVFQPLAQVGKTQAEAQQVRVPVGFDFLGDARADEDDFNIFAERGFEQAAVSQQRRGQFGQVGGAFGNVFIDVFDDGRTGGGDEQTVCGGNLRRFSGARVLTYA